MEIGSTFSRFEEEHDVEYGVSWSAGDVLDLLVCPACGGVILTKYFWHEWMEPDEVTIKALYPLVSEIPRGLPPKIEQEYEAALRVRSVSANAYGVLLGRLLELVCDDRGAAKGELSTRLKLLADNGEIPEKLVEMAKTLSQYRHLGAHAWAGELTPEEVPILDGLCSAILEYVYGAPLLVREAEERLATVRRPRGAPRNSSE